LTVNSTIVAARYRGDGFSITIEKRDAIQMEKLPNQQGKEGEID
jgi:hypothetical protein